MAISQEVVLAEFRCTVFGDGGATRGRVADTVVAGGIGGAGNGSEDAALDGITGIFSANISVIAGDVDVGAITSDGIVTICSTGIVIIARSTSEFTLASQWITLTSDATIFCDLANDGGFNTSSCSTITRCSGTWAGIALLEMAS